MGAPAAAGAAAAAAAPKPNRAADGGPGGAGAGGNAFVCDVGNESVHHAMAMGCDDKIPRKKSFRHLSYTSCLANDMGTCGEGWVLAATVEAAALRRLAASCSLARSADALRDAASRFSLSCSLIRAWKGRNRGSPVRRGRPSHGGAIQVYFGDEKKQLLTGRHGCGGLYLFFPLELGLLLELARLQNTGESQTRGAWLDHGEKKAG